MEHNWFILGDFETLGPFRWWENHHDGWSHSKKPCDRCGDIFEQQFSPRAGARVTPHIEEPQLFRCVAPRVVEIFLRGQRECCKYQNLRFWFLRNGMPPKGKNNQLHRSWDIFAFFRLFIMPCDIQHGCHQKCFVFIRGPWYWCVQDALPKWSLRQGGQNTRVHGENNVLSNHRMIFKYVHTTKFVQTRIFHWAVAAHVNKMLRS